MKILFTVTAVLTLLLGVVWLFVPDVMLASWGVQGDEVAVYMSRRYGGLFFGYTVILWLARTAESSPARTAMLAGGATVTSLMAAVSFYGVVTGLVGPMVWSAVGLEVLLAAGFTYFYMTGR